MKILVVDDQDDICEFMKDLLEVHGCEVFTAGSGEEALDITKEVDIDAAYLDICLPGMDGVETMKELMKRAKNTKFFLMTGAPDEDRVREGLDSGASACFMKPFQIADVLEAIGIISC